MSRASNGIANANLSLGNDDSAIQYLNKALEYAREADSKLTESRSLNDLGHIHRRKGDIETALKFYTQSLEMRRELDYLQGITTSLMDIGSLKTELKHFDEAEASIKEALEPSTRIKAKVKISRAYLLLHELYHAQQNYQSALDYFVKHHKIDKKIFQDESTKQLSTLKDAHQAETIRKEAEINRLKNIELKEKNTELEQTLKRLSAAQAQLIQSGKTSALGKLVAGIVHEFNTPTGVINSSIDVLDRALKKLPNIINESLKSKSNLSHNGLSKVLAVIEQNSNTNRIATKRIIEIIKNLKNFTRLDEAAVQYINIEDSLDTVVELLKMDTPNNVSFVKEYGGVPRIKCMAADINQVFMNLLTNALHELKEGGKIVIKTQLQSRQISISITDNGKGIQPENIETLFEPGFTEKGSRVQMRSGLYTSSNIINNHQGTIEVYSIINQETTFVVTLPLKGLVKESLLN